MAPSARPGGLDNADGVPERALIHNRQPRGQGRVRDRGTVDLPRSRMSRRAPRLKVPLKTSSVSCCLPKKNRRGVMSKHMIFAAAVILVVGLAAGQAMRADGAASEPMALGQLVSPFE